MIRLFGCKYEKDFNFPAGEQHVVIAKEEPQSVSILFEYEGDGEIFKLMLTVDALRRSGHEIVGLTIPYVPYARQDRVAVDGEPLSIKVFADVINGLNIPSVVVYDPHSEVTTALINNVVVKPQEHLLDTWVFDQNEHYLISPDGGATKKILKSINDSTIDVVTCEKVRNVMTGEITGTNVFFDDFHGKTCVIVDDICDGGRTFIEIAKVLKTLNAGEIVLCVTHGLFTKGLEVFDGLIDKIYTHKGRAK
jgi:ribose-phosphate pyrophosphokinase